MHMLVLKSCLTTPKQSEFGVGVKAAMPHPFTEKQVASRERPYSRRVLNKNVAEVRVLRCQLLIRIETQYPLALGFFKRRILLRGETFPRFDKHLRAVALG